MHDIIIGIVIITVVIFQIKFFIENYSSIKLYKNSLKQVKDLELSSIKTTEEVEGEIEDEDKEIEEIDFSFENGFSESKKEDTSEGDDKLPF